MKKVEITKSEYYALVFTLVLLIPYVMPKLVLALIILAVIVSAPYLWGKFTWISRIFVSILPPAIAVLCVVNSVYGSEEFDFDKVMKCLDNESLILSIYYFLAAYFLDEDILSEKPKYRRLLYRNYAWEGWDRIKTMSFYLKYKGVLRQDELTAISDRLLQLRREKDEKALDEFKRKTGLQVLPTVENPDELLYDAAELAVKRGWVSSEEICRALNVGKDRSEIIVSQLCKLRVCGKPEEVCLAELGEDVVGYMLNEGKFGNRSCSKNEEVVP